MQYQKNIGFRLHDVINTKEQTVLKSIKYAFEGENEALEKELDCMFIRINPDGKNLNIFQEVNKIHWHIKNQLKNHWLIIFQKDWQN